MPTPSEWGASRSLKERRQALLDQADLKGVAFTRAYAEAADDWLQTVFTSAVADHADKGSKRAPGGAAGLVLMAVGGYGRRELYPGSDLDLVLVHSARRSAREVKAVAEAIWYPIWDQGVRLDHSVRTVSEALAVAGTDLRAALGLLDARVVAGDPEIGEELTDKAMSQWRTQGRRRVPELVESVRQRHRINGEAAFLLEPDLKEARGGLRDHHAIRALDLATPVLADVAAGPELDQAVVTLCQVRVALQRRTGKSGDVLRLQEQDGVAELLGLEDADRLMADVATSARCLAWVIDDGLRRVTSWLAGPKGHDGTAERRLGKDLVLRDGEVTIVAGAQPSTDCSLAWRTGAEAAQLGAPIARTSLARLVAEAPAMEDPWPLAALQGLLALLGAGPNAIEVLETFDQHGLLVRMVPEWSAVRNLPQRNAYHRFTVDRHLCEAAARAGELVRNVARPDLLLVGAWLHDIGKGYPGDHTEAGIKIVAEMAPRLGFAPSDCAVLVDLVRHHLLLPDTATRRDLDDPSTIELVVSSARSTVVLELLTALTEADSLATGPAAWGPWKAQLVAELSRRAMRVLEGAAIGEPPNPITPEHRSLIDAGRLAVACQGSTLTIAAPDQPGLLSAMAGVLALNGLDIRSASALPSSSGMAIDVFDVDPGSGAPIQGDKLASDKLASDLTAALEARLPLEARLMERARAYGAARRPSSATPAEPRVLVDNRASSSATVVEVRAPDAIGLLFRITGAIAACGLDVASARVNTLGHEVVDSFYVRDATGAKITDGRALEQLEAMILAGLAKHV